jgi:hypothetical protein
MVLKEVQSTNILTPVSSSGIYYSMATQPTTAISFQDKYKQQKRERN